MQDESSKRVRSEVLLQSSKSWNNQQMPQYLEGVPQCTILKITVPPHTRLPEHTHPMLNAGVVVKGELHVVDCDGNEIALHEGEPVLECVDKLHYGENLTDEDTVLYMFYAGVVGMPLSESI
ncbi:MAG: cupin domain-containing protein [Bacteroidales bacterium]|nr:cupin domain-containing protein [Bacteroidales bacterium]